MTQGFATGVIKFRICLFKAETVNVVRFKCRNIPQCLLKFLKRLEFKILLALNTSGIVEYEKEKDPLSALG